MAQESKLRGARKPRATRAVPGVIAQARVHLWDQQVGTITEFQNGRIGFAYARDYLDSGVSISPRFLPLESRIFEFPELRGMDSFLGLPGVLADSLPDTFGNLVIRNYFESLGQPDNALSPVERLLYVGKRAMGALEYTPQLQRKTPEEEQRAGNQDPGRVGSPADRRRTGRGGHEIMRVGGSAGGARAKALILWDRERQRVRSGFARPRDGERRG